MFHHIKFRKILVDEPIHWNLLQILQNISPFWKKKMKSMNYKKNIIELNIPIELPQYDEIVSLASNDLPSYDDLLSTPMSSPRISKEMNTITNDVIQTTNMEAKVMYTYLKLISHLLTQEECIQQLVKKNEELSFLFNIINIIQEASNNELWEFVVLEAKEIIQVSDFMININLM